MKNDNRETMQRAIGIIEGVLCAVSESVQDTLLIAVEMLDDVMSKEDQNDN